MRAIFTSAPPLLGLVLCAVSLFCGDGRATGQTVDTSALNAVIEREVLDCLGQKAQAKSRVEEETISELPGIGRQVSNLRVVRLKSAQGRLFKYVGIQGNEILCGIALYNAPSKTLFEFTSKLVRERSRFVEDNPPHYRLNLPPLLQTIYFGDPKARGLIGVLVVAREPTPNAPSFQFDYHQIMLD